MKRLCAICFYLIFSSNVSLFGEIPALNATFSNKDGRSVALGGGINAIEKPDSSGILISYFMPYNLSELSTRRIAGTCFTEWVCLDGQLSQTGNEVFMENYLSFGASRLLARDFIFGIKGGYYHYTTINDAKGSTLLSEIYCYYKPFEKMQICIYLFNPTNSKIRQSEVSIPLYQSFHLGGSFFPVKNTELLCEFEKTQIQDLTLHLGCESSVFNSFKIRVGLSAQPLMPSFGIGGKLYRFKYALGWNLHPVLGVSSCLSIQYNW